MNDQLRLLEEARTKRNNLRLFWGFVFLVALISFTLGRCV